MLIIVTKERAGVTTPALPLRASYVIIIMIVIHAMFITTSHTIMSLIDCSVIYIVTDNLATPDPNPRNVVNWCL